jgi:RNA polymerase sigma factor (sigma-70 family)
VIKKFTQDEREDGLRQFYAYKTSFIDRAEAEQDPEAVRLAWEVVSQNKALIYWVLRHDMGYTKTVLYNHDDTASYLIEALYDAAWNHEPSLGTFATYAVSCLRYQLIQSKTIMRIQHSPFSAPHQMSPKAVKLLSEIKRAIEEERLLPHDYHRFGDRLAVYERHLAVMTGAYTNVKKLKVRDDDGFFLEERSPMELVVDEDSDPQESSTDMLQTERARCLALVLEGLTWREARIIELRYGLEDGISQSLIDVGRAFGVTAERIRQIEAKALRKMRHPTRTLILEGLL